MTNEQKRKQLTAMFGAYSKRLETLYDKFIDRLSVLAHNTGVGVEDLLEKNPLFRFGNYPEMRNELNGIFSDYVQNDMLAYKAGITDGVALAYSHDALVLSGYSVLSDKAITTARNTAAATLIRSRMKPEEGLGLSQLVWNYASQTKSEFDMAVTNVIADGLKKGTSAAELSLKVRQYLNNPDMMYRRYHHVFVDKGGNKKDVVKWRRKVVDEEGNVRFVEAPLEEVGMGHYRSSKRNADRLMRTEINAAYHRANAERWQLEPFVIGIMIELSPQHPEPDMCDDLAGRYPKDFVFTGWHPQCLCMSNPITIQGEEKKDFYKRLAAGEDMSDYVSPHAVREIPDSAKSWINDNHDQFIKAAERGKLGWVWRDNMKYVGKQFSNEELTKMGYADLLPKKRIKTDEEKAAIQALWDERKKKNNLIIKTGKNVWVVADTLDYTEVSGMKNMLKKAIDEKDISLIQDITKNLAKGIASINHDASVFGEYIPNIKEHLKNVTIAELQGVYEGVASKIKFIESKYAGDLLKQSQKYAWEATDYLGANMYGVQEKYPTTWKISQEAYLNLAQKTKTAYDWKEVNNILIELEQFDTKSKPLKAIIQELDTAISEGKDLAKAQDLAYKGQAKKKQIIYDREYANKSKGIGEFSEERKSAAIWDTGNGQLADDTLFPTASKAWRAATKLEKEKVYEYTHHYCDKNEPLQGRRYVGHQTRNSFETKVNAITRYIERNTLPEDMWFMRGDDDISVIKSRIEFAGGKWPNKLQDLVGMTMQEGGFMSTASKRGAGFESRDVIINIFAPKGTKAAYIEPFSEFGCGKQSVGWDGLERFTSFSKEDETLFQRGTKMRITRVYQNGYKTYIDVEIVGQELKDLSYVLDDNIGY